MPKKLTAEKIQAFQNKIFKWYAENKRALPWRETTDPYCIMVSEFMLQQTQVSRVIPKYRAFIERFPTLESLATAQLAEVLILWSGLGYNRRAVCLHQAAKELVAKGYFPNEPRELERIKGIGKYTARSIVIFAFNKDIATVDTNIRRIFIHEGFATENSTEKELFLIANQLLPKGRSRDWHNALMDYGSLVVNAKNTGITPKSKQSKFQGSDRQYRGRVLRYLVENEKATLNELITQKIVPTRKIEQILENLLKDKLIIQKDGYYTLP